jgi:hypothetical protein
MRARSAAKGIRALANDPKQMSLFKFFQPISSMSRSESIISQSIKLEAPKVPVSTRTVERRVVDMHAHLDDICSTDGGLHEKARVLDAMCTRFFGQTVEGRQTAAQRADSVINTAIVASMVRGISET